MLPKVLLLAVVGSQAYGLATSESDHDYLGVFQEPTRNLVGLKTHLPESIVSKDPDKTLHEVGKFMRLALAGNPTVNELLWLDRYEERSVEGLALLSVREAFLSNKMRATYGGYALQQAKRLARGDVESNQRNRIEKHGRHCFRLLMQGSGALRTGRIQVWLSENQGRECFEMGFLAATDPEGFQDEVQLAMNSFDAIESVLPDQPDYEKVDDLLLRLRNDGSLG